MHLHGERRSTVRYIAVMLEGGEGRDARELDSNIRHLAGQLLFAVERYIFSRRCFACLSFHPLLRHDLRRIRMKSDVVAFYVSSLASAGTPLCAPLSSLPVCS